MPAARHRGAFHPGEFVSGFESHPSFADKYASALKLRRDGTGCLVAEVNVAAKIIEVPGQIDTKLVVMGTRERSGLTHFLRDTAAEGIGRFCGVRLWA